MSLENVIHTESVHKFVGFNVVFRSILVNLCQYFDVLDAI